MYKDAKTESVTMISFDGDLFSEHENYEQVCSYCYLVSVNWQYLFIPKKRELVCLQPQSIKLEAHSPASGPVIQEVVDTTDSGSLVKMTHTYSKPPPMRKTATVSTLPSNKVVNKLPATSKSVSNLHMLCFKYTFMFVCIYLTNTLKCSFQ